MKSMQYGRFAASYDAMMHDVDRNAWADYLDGFLKETGSHDVLDCACGTGAMMIALYQRGYHMLGSDVSPEMLMQAKSNAMQVGCKSIVFVCEDMRKISIHKPVDAILCACDGVNYLMQRKDVAAFFRRAYDSLKPGGLLLFDVSSAYKLSTVLGCNTFTEETADYAYIWKNAYDAKTKLCEMNLTCFVKNGEKFDRFSETHLQRAYTERELTELLEQTGYQDIHAYHAFTKEPVRADSERIQFAARKEA